jgi:hypothetical protein
MLKALPLGLLLIATAISVTSVQGQYGGAGGGGASPGIPLGSGGSHDETPKSDEDKKKSATERPVSGVVTDADGKPVVGAVVQLKDTRTLKILSLITREKGEYRFSGLNKNVDYQLTANFRDHASAPHTLSAFDPRPQPVVNLQIK